VLGSWYTSETSLSIVLRNLKFRPFVTTSFTATSYFLMHIYKFLCEPMHFLFTASWYRRSIVIPSTSRMSNSSLQPISFHITSSTAFRLLKHPSSLRENKRLAGCETLIMQPARWQEALMTALFSAMTYFKIVLAQAGSCQPPVESQSSRGTFSEHRTFYHHADSPRILLFNQRLYLCNYLPRNR